jgi:hypothetical protein
MKVHDHLITKRWNAMFLDKKFLATFKNIFFVLLYVGILAKDFTIESATKFIFAPGLIAGKPVEEAVYEPLMMRGQVFKCLLNNKSGNSLKDSLINWGQERNILELSDLYKRVKEENEKEVAPENIVIIGSARGGSTALNFAGSAKGIESKDAVVLVVEGVYDVYAKLLNKILEGRYENASYHSGFYKVIRTAIENPIEIISESDVNIQDLKTKHPFSLAHRIRNIPILLVASKEDSTAELNSIRLLYLKLRESGHLYVHLLELESGKNGAYLEGGDSRKYICAVHAFYKYYGISAYNRILAGFGEQYFAASQPSSSTVEMDIMNDYKAKKKTYSLYGLAGVMGALGLGGLGVKASGAYDYLKSKFLGGSDEDSPEGSKGADPNTHSNYVPIFDAPSDLEGYIRGQSGIMKPEKFLAHVKTVLTTVEKNQKELDVQLRKEEIIGHVIQHVKQSTENAIINLKKIVNSVIDIGSKVVGETEVHYEDDRVKEFEQGYEEIDAAIKVVMDWIKQDSSEWSEIDNLLKMLNGINLKVKKIISKGKGKAPESIVIKKGISVEDMQRDISIMEKTIDDRIRELELDLMGGNRHLVEEKAKKMEHVIYGYFLKKRKALDDMVLSDNERIGLNAQLSALEEKALGRLHVEIRERFSKTTGESSSSSGLRTRPSSFALDDLLSLLPSRTSGMSEEPDVLMNLGLKGMGEEMQEEEELGRLKPRRGTGASWAAAPVVRTVVGGGASERVESKPKVAASRPATPVVRSVAGGGQAEPKVEASNKAVKDKKDVDRFLREAMGAVNRLSDNKGMSIGPRLLLIYQVYTERYEEMKSSGGNVDDVENAYQQFIVGLVDLINKTTEEVFDSEVRACKELIMQKFLHMSMLNKLKVEDVKEDSSETKIISFIESFLNDSKTMFQNFKDIIFSNKNSKILNSVDDYFNKSKKELKARWSVLRDRTFPVKDNEWRSQRLSEAINTVLKEFSSMSKGLDERIYRA